MRRTNSESPRPRRSTLRFRALLAGFTVLSTTLATLAVPGAAASDSPEHKPAGVVADIEVLLEWNTIAQAQTIPLRPTAHGQTRGIAMVQGAVYDAVNAIDRGHQPYLLDVDALDIDPGASYEAAIATAAHHVLVEIVPATQVAGLDAAYAETLLTITEGPSKVEGKAAGQAAAAAMITARTDDGFADPFEAVIGLDPGDWRPVTPTALDPDAWVGELDPFLIDSPSQFRSKGPHRLTSKAYAKDFREVKEVGSLTSKTRTQDQTTSAIFWQAPPTAIWNRLFRDLSTSRGLDAVDASRLFAAVNLAAADGAISCWDDKYHWYSWRPMAAIREADTDGNPATIADADWKPLFDPSTATTPPLTTPPFPEHPSGHGCVSGAVLHTAREFFGKNRIEFDVHSTRFPGQPRHFTSFRGALDEIIDARVWGGIHFRTADEQGAKIGKQVARWLDDHYFQPLDKPAKVADPRVRVLKSLIRRRVREGARTPNHPICSQPSTRP